ncbi:MAG: UDP-N-acetylmuramoyl-L-alanyl-D-glutamate--2,6-diaminopimelate ligase [Gemmatimonadales bacterium]|nr:UDP-N-acetylmuramoyl-L-alanyl-D-glutamate--2,6-diaminopimelate ligase [Gemmatimonadales bacterium]
MRDTPSLIAALRRTGLLRLCPERLPSFTGLTTDSRKAAGGALFIAVRGSQQDGLRFVPDALTRGAAAIVAEAPVGSDVPTIVVHDARKAAIALAKAWYDEPAAGMRLVGITGTNGKTTTTGLVRHLLNREGDAASIGTLGAFDGAGAAVPSTAGSLTTPGPVDLHATFAELRDRGVRSVAMETSSHSLDQGRLDGLLFHAAVFTNLTRDHLDYHGTMEHYLAAKAKLLTLLEKKAVVAVNADDPAWAILPRTGGTVSFGFHPDADLRASGAVLESTGSRFRLEGRFGTREVSLPLPGEFNIANALAAAAVALGFGLSLEEVAARLGMAPQVPGRMEQLASGAFVVLRDYAHTPDALERALRAIRSVTVGRVIVLFGCGGDRDRGKRPMMGKIAGSLADLTVITSDNPRTEDPEAILDEVIAGLPAGAEHLRVADRREAIRQAIGLAKTGDTLLFAGKGHETYQIIGKEYHPFDERQIVGEILGFGIQDSGERE